MGRAGSGRVSSWFNVYAMHLSMTQAEYLRERQWKLMVKKQLRSAYWTQRLVLALDTLRATDPEGWESWYDDSNNIADDASHREIAELCELRALELSGPLPKYTARIHREIFVWTDALGVFIFSKEIDKKPLYILNFKNRDEAKSFIDGLPVRNLGYGVVLDILPAGDLAQANAEKKEAHV